MRAPTAGHGAFRSPERRRLKDRVQTPPLVFSALLGASLLIRCGGSVAAGGGTGSSSREGGISGSPANSGGASLGGANGAGGDNTGGGGGGLVVRMGPLPIDLASCETADGCPVPPAQCESGRTAVYYTDPACPSGSCQWTRHERVCATDCTNGTCAPVNGADAASVNGADGAPAAERALCSNAEAGACPLPQSVCLDMWDLLYFANPRCVAGECQSEAHIEQCNNSCRNGGCMPFGTH